MGNVESLPKWAQQALKLAYQKVDAAESAARLAFGEERSLIETDPYKPDGGHRRFLPNSTTVRFAVDGGHIDVRLRDGSLEIMGLCALVARPQAANVFSVAIESDT